jgi:predicted ATPase
LPTDRITLDPLTESEARSLITVGAPELSEEVVNDIISQAGGNPLYLELLASGQRLHQSERLPESLETAVVARVDELDDRTRRLLREASIFGQSLYEEPLKLTVSEGEWLYESLSLLCEAGLIAELPDPHNRRYQFRHSVVQQALYGGLLRRERGELHLRAAEALELAREEGLEVEPEQIAYHYREGGQAERAAAYYLAAGGAEWLQAHSRQGTIVVLPIAF